MRQRSRFSILVFLAIDLSLLSVSRGQAGNGELAGEVRDASQKIVPGARVLLTEQSTNLHYESASNDEIGRASCRERV